MHFTVRVHLNPSSFLQQIRRAAASLVRWILLLGFGNAAGALQSRIDDPLRGGSVDVLSISNSLRGGDTQTTLP